MKEMLKIERKVKRYEREDRPSNTPDGRNVKEL